MYYFYFLPLGINLRQVNDGKYYPTLQAEWYSSFQVQIEDDTHVSYM